MLLLSRLLLELLLKVLNLLFRFLLLVVFVQGETLSAHGRGGCNVGLHLVSGRMLRVLLSFVRLVLHTFHEKQQHFGQSVATDSQLHFGIMGNREQVYTTWSP